MKIAVIGANGRMGRSLIKAIHEPDSGCQLVAATVREGSPLSGTDAGLLATGRHAGVPLGETLPTDRDDVDVAIDFTLPEALKRHLQWCVAWELPLVLGVTGLDKEQKALLREASSRIPIVFAANFSVGVNLLLNLARQAARVMGESADIEIIEAHHRHKQDAPSGTALAIGKVVARELDRDFNEVAVYARQGHTGEREANSIGFATVRAGDVVGEHTLLLADIGERLELTHKASSRQTFAKGALRAARWATQQQPGLYDMQDVLGLK